MPFFSIRNLARCVFCRCSSISPRGRSAWPAAAPPRTASCVVDGPIGAAALAGRWHEAETALARASERPGDWHGHSGAVFLVGAGPGDPDLLTLRALQALQGADVVLYDETVSEGILDRARRDAERIFAGRRAGGPGIGQDAINRRLADAARQGRNAVHLKGGDPFSFARGGEEIDYLRHAGVAIVVVPGVTATLARAAVAALPPASEIAA
jgi:uroporphyrin-III C-methyltransferase/precorrin-2 dehydrogenase/sirohydrochlorin ferrochelatase